jgi:hypothetical protein
LNVEDRDIDLPVSKATDRVSDSDGPEDRIVSSLECFFEGVPDYWIILGDKYPHMTGLHRRGRTGK